jgi:hypothetical protein
MCDQPPEASDPPSPPLLELLLLSVPPSPPLEELLLPLSVPPSVPPLLVPPSAGMQALPPMAARPMARSALVGVPHVIPAPHSEAIAQIWTGPPSREMVGQGDAAQTVPGVVPVSCRQHTWPPVQEAALAHAKLAPPSPPLLLVEPPDDDPPPLSVPLSSVEALLLDDELQPAAMTKPRPREATKKIFELCMENRPPQLNEKQGGA